jgi:hypothetical protein
LLAKEAKSKLHLMGIKEVRWDKMALNQEMIIYFSVEKGMFYHRLGTDFFTHEGIVSAVKESGIC